jgi:hypothetical protein
MASGVYFFGCIVYWFFASGEIQPWAKDEENDKKNSLIQIKN